MKVALLGAELEENTSLSILTKSLLGSSVLYIPEGYEQETKKISGGE